MSIVQALIGSIVSSTSGGGGGGTYNSWTVEWFQKSNATQPSSFPRVFGVATYPSQPIGFSLESAYYGWKGGQGINTSQTIAHNVWQHWVMVSDGTYFAMFKDGVRTNYVAVVDTATVTNPSSESNFYVGVDSDPNNGYKGLITNFRVVKNQAMYDPNSSTLPVPAVPLTSNSNTQLLLKAFNEGSLTQDTSPNGRIPWGTGNIAHSADTPFTAAGPYTQFSNIYGGTTIDFGTSYYNADLLNVKAGWEVTDGVNTGTVISDAYLVEPGYIRININFETTTTASYTFTQPALGGSIEFYTSGYGYIAYDPGTQWALDVI